MKYNVLASGGSKYDYNETKSAKTWLFGCCFDSNYCVVLAKDYRYDMRNDYRGCFAVVEIREDVITISTDSFGLGKIFYYFDDEIIIVSDNVDCIVKSIDKELSVNYGAWAEFLTFHYTLGEKTFFNEIHSLRINESVSVELNGGTLRRSYDDNLVQIRKNKCSVSYSNAINEIVKIFTQVVERVLNAVNMPLFPISGGYDSRCILGMASNLSKDTLSYTTDFDDGNNKDIIYGNKVANALHVRHECFPLSSEYYLKVIDDYLISANYCTNMYTALYAFYKTIFPYKGSTIINGYGGDLLFRGLKQDLSLTDEESFYRACFQKYKMNHKNATSTKVTNENVEKLAFYGLKQELKQCDNDLLIFLLANRNKNNVAYGPYIICMENQCVCPFLDNEVVKFVLSLPDEIRLNENFYIDILKRIDPLLAIIPGTNNEDKEWCYKPLMKASEETIYRFIGDSNQHWTKSRGLFSPELLHKNCKNFDYDCKTNNEFQKVELPWMLIAWFNRYDKRLSEDTIIDYIKSQLGDEKDVAESDKYLAVEYIELSEKRRISQKWIDLWNAEKTGQETLDVLMTMDVESYREQDIFASHTAKDGQYYLLYGGGNANTSVIKKIIDAGIKFTFFADIFNDAIPDSALREVLLMCNQNGCEVGIHCHHFSLPEQYCAQHKIQEYYDYLDIIQKVISDGTKRLSALIGERPVSYRAGSFRIEEGCFEVLKQNGFLVDSSSFKDNPFQSSSVFNSNTPGWVGCDGVLELPVSSCWDLTAGARRKRFDFNTLQFDKKCEFIVKSALSDNSYLMMLSHSWSFLDGSVQSPKIYHEDFSSNAWDELERIVDLINNLDIAKLYTCYEYYRKNSEALLNDKCDNTLDLTGLVEKPVSYYLPPSYGGLRKIVTCEKEVNNMVDLSAGYLADSKKCPASCIKVEPYSVQLSLQETDPHSGDWVMYQVVPKLAGSFHMFVSITCAYYKEKFVGRNSIVYKIILDGNTIYQKFITDKDDDDLKAFDVELCEDSELSFVLECIKSEKPWHWNVASKTVIRGIYFKKAKN